MATNEPTSAIKQTATLKGGTQMHTNRETSVMKEGNMKITASNLIRWTGVAAMAAGLLAVASAVIPAAALLPHATQRLAAIPVGLAVAWLGFALLSERREQASEPVPGRGSPQFSQTAAE